MGMGWDLCAGLLYEHRFAMLRKENYYRLMHSTFSSLLLIFCKIENLHPAQVKVSHEAILPEKENLVLFFRRETGAMVSGD